MGKFSRIFAPLAAALLPVSLAIPTAGCGKPASGPAKPGGADTEPVVAVAPEQKASTEGPGKDEKICFACNGQGTVACRAPGCQGGKVDCPAPCLKLTRGAWVHMTVAGHDPSELWQKFPNTAGKGGYQAWNQHHVGEVIAMQNGQAVNLGPCKVCGGTTKIECKACKGQGKQACDICAGKKFIPVAWTPTDNPWFNRQPDLIRLKDGRVVLGRVAASSGEDRTIVTRDSKIIHVNASEMLPKPDSASPLAR